MKTAASVSITPLPEPVTTEIEVPGSKSYTNRALLLAALASGPVRLIGPLFSDDTQAMVDCLRELGIRIEAGKDFIEVRGSIDDVREDDYELSAELSGTTMRFLLALCAILPGRQILRGQKRLEERPIGDLVDSLKQLGADIRYLGREGYPPVRVASSKLRPGTVRLNGGQSSQYLSAILMIAPLVGDLAVEIQGDLISKPYADMTIAAMRDFGVTAVNDGYRTFVVGAGQKYACSQYLVEGDASGAAYFFAIAALTGSVITVPDLGADSKQADMKFLDILKAAGAGVDLSPESVTVTGHGLKPVDVDMQDCPDQAQTLAVLMAFADGASTIRGIRSLRVKETERVKALEKELAKMGIKTSSTVDSLTIHGGQPHSAVIDTYNDHRMAMAFAVAGAKLPGMSINDPGVVSKTFPAFWEKLREIGIGIGREGKS